MSAYLRGSQDLGIKIVSIYKDNPSKGIPTVTAIVVVLDSQTGRPRALIEGDSLTAIRTGATGGLASELLARRNAKTVALFGAGVQARAQLQGVIAVRSITRINLLDLSLSASQKLLPSILYQTQKKPSKMPILSSRQRPLLSPSLTARGLKPAPT